MVQSILGVASNYLRRVICVKTPYCVRLEIEEPPMPSTALEYCSQNLSPAGECLTSLKQQPREPEHQ